MATKTGIPRVGVEQYNTNIKSPGINKHTTYTKGEVAEITDYAKVNRDIQKSIANMGEELGEFVAAERERKTLDPDVAAELGLDPESTYSRGDFIANQMKENPDMTRKEARQAWRRAKKGSQPADVDDTSIEEKKQIVNEVADEIGEKSDNAFTNAAEDILGGRNFNQLNRRQKILAKKQLGKLAQTKQSMATLMTEWAGADPNDISWKKYGSHPDVADFMQYIISGDGAEKDGLPYTFSSENGGTILYGDNKKLLMRDLEAGKHIYATADNKQLKEDVAETTKNNVAILLKAEDKIIKSLNDQSTKPTDEAYEYNREQNIRDMVRAEYNQGMYEDVWNAEMRNRFENGRYVNYNPEKHQQLVEDYLYEQYNEKMGEQSPLLTRDMEDVSNIQVDPVKGGKVRIGSSSGGYKDVDAALFDRINQNILPAFKNMLQDPNTEPYGKNNPLPKIERPEYEAMFKDAEKTTGTAKNKKLNAAIEADRGGLQRGHNRLNNAVERFNAADGNINDPSLSAGDRDMIKAYIEYEDGFDENFDLNNIFDKASKVKNVNFDRSDKIISLDLDGERQTFDLKNPTEFEEFAALVIKRTGDDSTDGTFILKQLLFKDGAQFKSYKRPLTIFDKEEKNPNELKGSGMKDDETIQGSMNPNE